jgi:hypothetical protein
MPAYKAFLPSRQEKRIPGDISWYEEGKALDMIPVEMTEQEGTFSAPPTKRGTHEFITENSQTCASV